MRLTTLFSLILLSTLMALAGQRLNVVSNVEGDVNADGDVTIADVNVVIDAILTGVADMNCDVNKDGDITIADINVLLDIILSGPQIHTVDTGMYMGITGFNQTLYTKPIAFLDSASVPEFNDFISSVPTQAALVWCCFCQPTVCIPSFSAIADNPSFYVICSARSWSSLKHHTGCCLSFH